MFFLQLLVVFSVFLSTQQQVEKNCEYLNLNSGQAWKKARPCSQTSGVRVIGKTPQSLLRPLNSLQIIDSSNVTDSHFVSLNIQNTKLVYSSETFLPNLTGIIPAHNSTASAIIIRGNKDLCIPKEVKDKLLNMVNGQGYVQPCSCRIQPVSWKEIKIEGENCDILYGGLLFNENITLTEKMRKQLETVVELHGYISIDNSNLTSLDFLRNLKKVFYPPGIKRRGGKNYIVYVANNEKLKSLGFLLDIVQDEKKVARRHYSVIAFLNNTQLTFTQAEREYYYNFIRTEMDFYSVRDPVFFWVSYCTLIEPIWNNTEVIKDCSFATGNLTIDSSFDDYSPEQMEEIFGELRHLRGCLTIRDTKWTNLTFLHDLVYVRCPAHRPAMIIEDNPKLKMLDVQFNDFSNSQNVISIKISNNPKLCPKEVDYLKTIVELDSPWRRIDFDGWDKDCGEESHGSALKYYHTMVAGILVVGISILETVARLIGRRRE